VRNKEIIRAGIPFRMSNTTAVCKEEDNRRSPERKNEKTPSALRLTSSSLSWGLVGRDCSKE
jgi:hypothetical protein